MRIFARLGLMSAAAALLAVVAVAPGVVQASSIGASHPEQSQPLCGLDVTWLQRSIQGDRFEIAGGRLAFHRSNDWHVRHLGHLLKKDHTESLGQSLALAARLNIPAPAHMDPAMHWEIEELAQMHGAEFNHDYAELEVADHHVDIAEAKDEVEM